MVDIPLKWDIQLLQGFSVCLFKHKRHSKEAPPHYFITIPTKSESYLVMCMSTSKWEEKKSFYEKSNKRCLASLIFLEKGDVSFVDRKCVLDCNGAIYIHRNELLNLITPNTFNFISSDISGALKGMIIKAILDCPVIKPHVKRSLVN